MAEMLDRMKMRGKVTYSKESRFSCFKYGTDPTIIWDIAAQNVFKLKKDISDLLHK